VRLPTPQSLAGSVSWLQLYSRVKAEGKAGNISGAIALRGSAQAGISIIADRQAYNVFMQRKIFWIVFALLGLVADFVLPLWWAVIATLPILYVSWWVAYRSDWF
jgi:hypothetical protein